MRIRPMRPADVDAAERVAARAFRSRTSPATRNDDVPSAGRGTTRPDDPDSGGTSSTRSPLGRQRWTDRLRHIIDVDGGGCWVADDGGDVVGVAAALRRDLLWVLSTYAVDPDHQRRGVGRALLDAAVGYGAGCLRGMLCAPPDPAALRLYRGAGFSLYPTLRLAGVVDRDVVPDVGGVRLATEADLELVDSVDRRARGATHRADHRVMAGYGPLLVCDLLNGSGYVYLDRAGIGLLAATSRAVGQRLLWAALAQLPPGEDVVVRYLTSDQEWALDVGLAAGLRIEPDGCLALRHMRPPMPYVPSVPFG